MMIPCVLWSTVAWLRNRAVVYLNQCDVNMKQADIILVLNTT